jgi:tetratricopeptide (TPR) repeat protein
VALAEFQKACDLSPDDPIAFAEFALALAQNSMPEAAIANYQKSLALDDANAGAQADLGRILVETSKTSQGFEHPEEAVALKPESAAVQSRFATAMLKVGQNKQAIVHWEKAVALSPDVKEFRYGLASALAAAGRAPDAVAQLQKAIEMDGGRDLRHARFRLPQGRPDQRCDPGRPPCGRTRPAAARRGIGLNSARQARQLRADPSTVRLRAADESAPYDLRRPRLLSSSL